MITGFHRWYKFLRPACARGASGEAAEPPTALIVVLNGVTVNRLLARRLQEMVKSGGVRGENLLSGAQVVFPSGGGTHSSTSCARHALFSRSCHRSDSAIPSRVIGSSEPPAVFFPSLCSTGPPPHHLLFFSPRPSRSPFFCCYLATLSCTQHPVCTGAGQTLSLCDAEDISQAVTFSAWPDISIIGLFLLWERLRLREGGGATTGQKPP